MVPLRLLFRNPELGHELARTSAEGNVAGGGSDAIVNAIVGGSPLHRTSIIRATLPTRSRMTPVANVVGDLNNANKPNTTSHAGMIAVRLNRIDMVVTFLSFSCRQRGARTATPPLPCLTRLLGL